MNRILHKMALVTALLFPGIALAQSEFDLDDFGTTPTAPEPTVAEEKNALLEEDPAGCAREITRFINQIG